MTVARGKYIVAMDSFKGSLSSVEAGNAVAQALHSRLGDVETVCLPMSDGGEGMLDAFTTALGGRIVETQAHDPLMRQITARYGLTADGTAVIETAQACGLTLMGEEERDPMRATTYGVGELVADAAMRGCRNFIVGLGGSGTSDAGKGMLQAIADRLAPNQPDGIYAISGILCQCRFTLACDVENPLCGANGAAMVFARQKGAAADVLPLLDKHAAQFAGEAAVRMGYDRSNAPGAGAAGGLGYAFMQFLNAEMRAGADMLLDMTHFDDLLDNATCVITGEGHADRQTLMGKLPLRVMRRADTKRVPTWLLAGRVSDRNELIEAGFAKVICITPDGMNTAEAMKKETALKNILNADFGI